MKLPGFPALLFAAFGMAAPLPAVSPDIVISQVYGGGGNSGALYTNDYIELFNRGSVAVDLAGWSVQYASSSGATWAKTDLAGALLPGQYYLVQQAQGAGGGVLPPSPDAAGTFNRLCTPQRSFPRPLPIRAPPSTSSGMERQPVSKTRPRRVSATPRRTSERMEAARTLTITERISRPPRPHHATPRHR